MNKEQTCFPLLPMEALTSRTLNPISRANAYTADWKKEYFSKQEMLTFVEDKTGFLLFA